MTIRRVGFLGVALCALTGVCLAGDGDFLPVYCETVAPAGVVDDAPGFAEELRKSDLNDFHRYCTAAEDLGPGMAVLRCAAETAVAPDLAAWRTKIDERLAYWCGKRGCYVRLVTSPQRDGECFKGWKMLCALQQKVVQESSYGGQVTVQQMQRGISPYGELQDRMTSAYNWLEANRQANLPIRAPFAGEPRERISLCGEWEVQRAKLETDFKRAVTSGSERIEHVRRVKDFDRSKWAKCVVPESHAGVSIYRRTFTLTPEQAKRRVEICFEGIGRQYFITVNGVRAVHEEMASTFFERNDLTPFVRAGENEIVIEVWPIFGDSGLWTQWPCNWKAGWENVYMGIYRPLYLELSDKVAITDVTVRPQVEPEKSLTAFVEVTNMTAVVFRGEVKAKVEGEQWNVLGSVELKPGEGKVVELRKKFPEAHLWSPADTYLYNMTASIRSDGFRDACVVPFGFREIRWKGGHRFFMNGHPITLRRTNSDYDCVKNHELRLRQMKTFRSRGITSYRIWTPSDLEVFADICDREGMLIATCFNTGWGAAYKTEEFWPRYERALRKMIRSLKNHPSVICWGVSNEFGGIYGGRLPDGSYSERAMQHQAEIGDRLLELDPTRPWEAYGEMEGRPQGEMTPEGLSVKGPMPLRSLHYPSLGNEAPRGARWYSGPVSWSWHGAFDKSKPMSISEDFYHKVLDSFTGMTKVGGDYVYESAGYDETLYGQLKTFAGEFYHAGLASWHPWAIHIESPTYTMFADGRASYHADWQFGILGDYTRNLRSGERGVRRDLYFWNEWFTELKDVTFVREWRLNGRPFGKPESERLTIAPGEEIKRTLEFAAPEVAEISTLALVCTMKGADGKTLATERFDFPVVPAVDPASLRLPAGLAAVAREGSALRRFRFPCGTHANLAAAASAPGVKAIAVDAPVDEASAAALERFVREGGCVLHLEPRDDEWCAAVRREGDFSQFLWKRDRSAMPEVPETIMRLWRGIGPDHPEREFSAGGAFSFRKPLADATVLWDSGRKDGLSAADVLRLWRGRGSWIVSAVPALERFDVEPAAPYFLAALFREAVRPVAAPAKTLVFDRKDGTFVTSLLESRGFEFKASSDKTAPADAVWLVDADGAPLDEGVKSAVRARCEKGGTVVLLNLVRDKVLDAACREQYAKRFEEAFRAAALTTRVDAVAMVESAARTLHSSRFTPQARNALQADILKALTAEAGEDAAALKRVSVYKSNWRVFVDLPDVHFTDRDGGAFADFLGIRWTEYAPKYTFWATPPRFRSEVLQAEQVMTIDRTSDLFRGLSNDDFFMLSNNEMYNYFRMKNAHVGQPTVPNKGLGRVIAFNEFTVRPGADTRLLTSPGVIAERRFASGGRLVFSTWRTCGEFARGKDERIARAIRGILNNLGAATSAASGPSAQEQLDISGAANGLHWADPKWGRKLWDFNLATDYRYFPVNLCGWSQASNNFCPIEDFPSYPFFFAGVSYRLLNPAKRDGRSVVEVRDAPVTISLKAPRKVRKLHFLGVGVGVREGPAAKPVKGASVRFGKDGSTVAMEPGDHFGLRTRNTKVKTGAVAWWSEFSAMPSETSKAYDRSGSHLYAWTIENPDPEKPVGEIVLDGQVDILAITTE